MNLPLEGNFPLKDNFSLENSVPFPQPPVFFQKYCRTNGGRTAVKMGGVLQYKWEAYCRVSLSSKFRSQESKAIQMGGVQIGGALLYFLDKL